MEKVGKTHVFSYFDEIQEIRKATNVQIRGGAGHAVSSYMELAKKVADLQFHNRDYVLLFRGQGNDYKNRLRNTTLKPTLFRASAGRGVDPPDQFELSQRFDRLAVCERDLAETFEREQITGRQRIARYRILRWSILQHYEVCATPLLDVSQSIRVAASFASFGARGDAFFYVLAVPNISGAVTASAEAGLQVIKLAGICPPDAVRPHIQEGFLLGEYPEMPDFDQKRYYAPYEIDFGRRLIAKFRLDLRRFWSDPNFTKIEHEALYPNLHDPLLNLLKNLGS
ncbi:FRG domain-containing protein [Dyella kyungheensis]|uniref:FRG domain-containing protein n=1 Tax=Dyella kyungheensis TaxID=1242174 RepID=A0ABS2JWX0_9GAMM|nr:FRG domain-containing protein [Dyella kyungheensis]MBM7122983.1 FRG domain-containing protein [Dyella kyungheensis]